MKIVFQNLDGTIGVIHPTQEVLNKYTMKQIADKDVPAGLSYKIVEDTAIPSDRTFRGAWELPVDTVFDGVGANSNEFPKG